MTNATKKLIAALAVAASIGTVAPSAIACGGGWWPEFEYDHRVDGIARAEADLEEGRYLAAAGSVIRMIPHIKGYARASNDAIVNRSMRVLAVATSRTGGDLSKIAKEIPAELHGDFLGRSPEERQANLRWAVHALKVLGEAKKYDLTLQSDLGEAMAQVPEMKAEAKQLLEKLAGKDLLATPESYRSLAELRAEAGDSAGRLSALERCRAMAGEASLCGAAELPIVGGQS